MTREIQLGDSYDKRKTADRVMTRERKLTEL